MGPGWGIEKKKRKRKKKVSAVHSKIEGLLAIRFWGALKMYFADDITTDI